MCQKKEERSIEKLGRHLHKCDLMDASYGEIFESAAKYFPKGADIEALKNLDAILTLI
jgi:hypothetical protein